MARYLLLFFALLLCGTAALSQTSLQGNVTEESGEPVIYGSVAIYKNGVLITGTETDLDGNYNFAVLDPGTYDLEVSYVGFAKQRVTGVKVFAGKANKLDVELSAEGVVLDEVVVTEYKVPLIEQDNTTSGGVITSDQIKNLPTRNINALAAVTAGLATADEGDDITVRGSRNNATDYYIDGIRIRATGNVIPESEIDQLQVITGGIEAQYGDVTGGIISITTKGPSNNFSGGVEIESSNLTDPYNQSLAGLSLTGPLIRKTNADGSKSSVLGFRIYGRVTDQLDDDPPAVNIYRVKDDVLAQLEQNPVVEVGGNPVVAAENLTDEDVDILDYQPYEEFRRYDLTAKLDARLSEAIDVTFTGTFSDERDQFTPNGNSRTLANWRVLNSHYNPTERDRYYRGIFRFRHRLGGGATDEDSRSAKVSLIQNASYTLQFGYEKNLYDLADERHGDNLFNYGYVGRFDQEWVPVPEVRFDTLGPYFVHVGNRQVLTGYEADPNINPVLANYNNPLSIEGQENLPTSIDGFFAANGNVLNVYSTAWNFHTNVGTVYNLNRKRDRDTYTFQGSVNFDLIPGSSNKGRHNIQLGVWYEQRTDRGYDIQPRQLWQLGRQLANNHIAGIPFDEDGNPLSDTIGVDTALFNGIPIEYALLDVDIVENPDELFYRSIRQVTGDDLKTFVNIDALRPEQLSLDMFSAKELNDFRDLFLDYYGYTYLGDPFDGTFDDFFTTTDPTTGVRTFPVAPFRPIYGAAYIQDKFTFKDIIFRLGVRVDRYDANTKVLKDNYSLYEISGAADYHSEFGGAPPGNIGEDYKVYATDETLESVLAYRDGDQWFRGNGNPVNNPSLIFQGGVVNPVYKDERVRDDVDFIKKREFDPNVSFEDYEVQVNFMPRLAFSFPISDEANFFAHYDILVQRPPSNNIATALDYFYFVERASEIKNNPNLLPERTITYEVGFQQKLSNTSALKVAAYYRELRDMIQIRTFFPVPLVGQYTTYDNQDFGTVKGFTFQYDLRRTGNISFNANYTLQFADGTGSDADSQRNLGSRGNLRTLFPLNFDERHRIVANIDYRYGSGRRYTGPRVGGADILANFGVGLQAIAVSGRPYTAKLQPLQLQGTGTVGAINGARNPWNFTLNLRVDKSFDMGERFGLNIYCRISNLLDRSNIINVYEATGSPEDDGFLASPDGQDVLSDITSDTSRDVNGFLASYQWRLLNPNFFSLPRRIFLGAIFDF